MPGLSVPIDVLADALAVAANKKVAVDWSQPSGDDGKHYQDAFPTAEHMHVPEPMCYFWAPSTNKYHVDQCKKVGKQFKDFSNAMVKGFKSAVDLWRVKVKVQNIKVNAGIALGTPGCINGPSIESDIKNLSLPAASGNEQKWRDAVAAGLAKQWKSWADNVMIPGLPWYPAMICFPGPMAPPMPNIPVPMMACPSPMMADMTPPQLESAMCDAFKGKSLDDPDDQFKNLIAKPIATGVGMAFLAWLPTQMIMNVMGKGQVPSFAPPYVPVGPVVMGDNIAIPGHIAA